MIRHKYNIMNNNNNMFKYVCYLQTQWIKARCIRTVATKPCVCLVFVSVSVCLNLNVSFKNE